MREWEITWVRRGQEPGEGTFIPQPDYCHHSRYVSGMVVREIVDTEADNHVGKSALSAENTTHNHRTQSGHQSGHVCLFCASPLIPLDVHGHVSCSSCKQVLSTCCPGSGNGETG